MGGVGPFNLTLVEKKVEQLAGVDSETRDREKFAKDTMELIDAGYVRLDRIDPDNTMVGIAFNIFIALGLATLSNKESTIKLFRLESVTRFTVPGQVE
jgi:hypothetical protein